MQDGSAVQRHGISALWNANPALYAHDVVPLAAPDVVTGADVFLDACLQCNGVWVGAGNLPAISRHYRQSLGRERPL